MEFVQNKNVSSREISGGIEEHVIRGWQKRDSYYKMLENLAELQSTFKWKVELISDELGYLAEEISMQSMKGATWFLLAAIVKCEGKR